VDETAVARSLVFLHDEALGALLAAGEALDREGAQVEGGPLAAHELREVLADRRRLLDRIAFIQTGVQCAQIPPSRTCRMVSNIEGWSGDDSVVEVRSNITIWEYRRERNCFVGVQSFRLRGGIDAYRIEMKIIDLVNSIDPQGNNSFII